MKNSALYLAAAAVGVFLLTRAQTLGSLVFVPRGLSPVGGGIRVIIGVQNPTSNALTLKSLAGTLNVNGSAFGNISDFQPAEIQPNQETQIGLTFTPSLFGIANSILNEVEDGSTSISASLTGTANVNDAAFPLNVNF